MRRANPISWLSGLLCVLLGCCWYFGKSETLHLLDETTLAHSVDFMITDLTFHEFGADGTLTRFIQTPQLKHIPFDNQFILEKPHLTLATDPKNIWKLSALEAHTRQGFDTVHFQGQVHLSQVLGPAVDAAGSRAVDTTGNRAVGATGSLAKSQPPITTLDTDSLSYFPTQDLLLTHSPVHFQQSTQTLLAQGMRAHLKQQHIQLDQAKADLHPPHEPEIHASANHMHYYPEQHLLVLKGHATITQQRHTLQAPIMRYDLVKQQFLTQATPQEHTHLLFYLDKQHANPLSNTPKKDL